MAERELWTIRRLLTWTTDFFKTRDIESPRLDAEVLLAAVLGKDRMYLYVHFDEPLEPAELSTFRSYVKERGAHTPMAYVLGRREFMGLEFCVTRDTLIPRPDTEILVQTAVDFLRARRAAGADAMSIADLGTGTGAIALSVLYHADVSDLRADAVDISPGAAAVARENAAQLGLAERCSVREGDLLAPLAGRTYDMIVSNPPYIPAGDIAELMTDVRAYEPHLALDGGADGLDFYRRMMADAPAMLKEGGAIAVEVGIGQAADVAALAERHPRIVRTETKKDLAGIERVVAAYGA
ncbi:protein-(glutamine-N5) methyltransferase, release factor-specific [Selenomonas sp. oral taxon 137 str. F0430]|uniref:peptide chain release factor N(5)-glutamine methyltransferase n=1 Tax=Selenomonas sp. oral taxon 137 TaxID=712531 RepID=UPI0001EB1EC1|nr:peptide chain release factor N(5)-glutamine methyltransferase [Selenomonas sp. oral taxon 137]EFR40937.1 protein-(glutamine-N5) methyltransferase, release factor-specific [Selenomonas sp. oral taxon 137 str. F0430]